jgi:hypothetical protein
MSRKRLTASTLESENKIQSAIISASLSQRLLGASASDDEIVAVGKVLSASISDQNLQKIHSLTAKIAAEMGEKYPIDDDGEPKPEETQNYVIEHELTPDHAVLDVVMNKKSPTQNPTASLKQAAEAECEEDEEDMEKTSSVNASDEEDDDLVEDPSELEEEMEEDEDDGLDDSDSDDLDSEEEEDEEDDLDAMPTVDDGEDEESIIDSAYDQESADEYYDNREDDGEFTEEDMQDLEDLGLEGVLTNKKPKKSSKKSKKEFRPSRVRKASSGDSFDQVFGTPDLGDLFNS